MVTFFLSLVASESFPSPQMPDAEPREAGGPEKRTRFLPISPSELPALVAASPLPPHLHKQIVVSYDTKQFPFREASAAVLGVGEEELARLHTTEQGAAVLEEERRGAAGRKRGKYPHYLKLWTVSKGTRQMERYVIDLSSFQIIIICRFKAILHSFVKSVVSQHMPTEVE